MRMCRRAIMLLVSAAAAGIAPGHAAAPGVLGEELEGQAPTFPAAGYPAGNAANRPAQAEWRVADVDGGTALMPAEETAQAGIVLTSARESAAMGHLHRCVVRDKTEGERAVTLALTVPVDATGWMWWHDPQTRVPIEPGRVYANLTEGYYGAVLMASRYPLAVIDNGATALCMAVPAHPSRAVRFLYDGQEKTFRAEFDFGLSPVPERFPSTADAAVYVFETEASWAFRRALQCYYAAHAETFKRRAGRGGGLLRGSPLAPIENPEDFHFAWHDFAAEWSPVRDWAALDQAHGIESYLYREPQTHWRGIRGPLKETIAAAFVEDAGLLRPEGGVRFEQGRAVLEPGAMLHVPGIPTGGPRDFEAEFTLHNLDALSSLGTYTVGWRGPFWCGLRKSPATGGVSKVGAFASGEEGRQSGAPWAGAAESRLTVKMVVRATENVTRVFAGFGAEARDGEKDPVLRETGIAGSGQWTGEESARLALCNQSAVPIEVDDVRIHYFGPTAEPSYENYLAQLEDEARRWNQEARATLVSGSFDADGRYNLYLGDIVWAPTAPFGINAAPNVHADAHPDWRNKAQHERGVAGFWLGWRGLPSQMDGLYFDSMQGWGNLRNYRREHWRSTHYPLTFDRTNGNAVCLQNIWANAAHAATMSRELHRRGQLLMGNDVYYQVWYHMPFVDIAGRELSNYADGKWSPPPDETYLYWRAMAASRPFWTLMNDRYDEAHDPGIAAHMEAYFQRSLFYGVFPGMYQPHDGKHPWYWATPAFYNRDRPLFRKYMPIIQDLDEAGWEPVPYAEVEPEAVRIERFGSGGSDGLAFTLHNPADAPAAVRLTLDAPNLGIGRIEAITERVHGFEAGIEESGERRPVVTLELPPRAYAALSLDIETR